MNALRPRPKKTALLWVNYGPYHLARYRALSSVMPVTAIQFAAQQDLYGWQTGPAAEIQTVFPGEYRSAPQSLLIRRLWSLLNRLQPDCLLIPGYSGPASIAAALWGIRNRALNILMTDSTKLDFPRVRVKETLKAALARSLFHRALASGSRASEYLCSLGFAPSRIGRYYDVVDNDFFSSRTDALRAISYREAFLLPQDYFLFVGRLVLAKQPLNLLRVFARYRSQGGSSSLVFVGRGPVEPELKAFSAQSGLNPYVQFRGFQDCDRIASYYAFARCLVLPSRLEQWGLVVNEAMASGLPVIVSDRCGCVDDLVQQNRNGFVFNADSEDDMLCCLQQASVLQEHQLRAMGLASREIISEFSLHAWTREVARLQQGSRSSDPPAPISHELQQVTYQAS